MNSLSYVLLAVVCACTSAFAPMNARVVPSSLKMSDMIGASVEVNGGKVYDPMGILKLHEVAPTAFPHPKWMREAELKHSRAAMLATVGVFQSQLGSL